MDHEQHLEDESFERIDADAVCEECSTVNPQGTLLCKTCGNNLRDQRTRRLATADAAVITPRSDKPVRVLTGLLTVLGLLAILWAAINVTNGNIEQWLTKGFEKTAQADHMDPTKFWTGSDANMYDDMLRQLDQNPITPAEAANGAVDGSRRDTVDGRYAISPARGAAPSGSAFVRTEGDTVHFVARLGEEFEIRGRAERTSKSQLEASDVAVKYDGRVLEAQGFARLQPDGTYQCTGFLAPDGGVFNGVAAYVP